MIRYSEFDEDQKIEIQAGFDAGFDVSFYDKPEFMAIQMRQIRIGLEEGLDVTVYNKVEYDWFQMEEIRKGLKSGIKYELYANSSIDYKRMRQIRKGLEQGIDLSPYVKLSPDILEELRKGIIAKVPIVDYIKEGYRVEQLTEIRHALERKINIRPYISVEYLGASIREIYLGLEKGLAVSIYASMDYGWQQMREIRLGMEARLEIELYSNSLYSWQQMREIRLGLEEGLDVSVYKSFMYTAADMECMRKKLLEEETEHILDNVYQENVDDNIAIFISKDEMEACIEVTYDSNQNITSQYIKEQLNKHGICFGVLTDEIERIVNEKLYKRTIVIAKGRPMEKGKDGWYEFFFQTKPNRAPKILEDGSADFRDVEWYELIKAGQKIAYYHEAGVGTEGCTVTGKRLRAKKGKEKAVLQGKGFSLQPDNRTYISTLNGKIELIGEKIIEISRVLVVQDVLLSTGDVHFDGTVLVRGSVGSGATITATDDIIVEGNMEAGYIQAGGSIYLRKGVNGGGVGKVEAKKNVVGQFFESIYVVAGEDIMADYCLNCTLNTQGTLNLYGRKGLLAGGFARAAKGIRAYNVGNKATLKTVLNVGIDNQYVDELLKVESELKNINREISILNNSYQDFKRKYAPEIRNTMEMYLKIENAIYTKALQMKNLYEKREYLETSMKEMTGAKVVVNGIMYEGTEIIIDNVKWKASGLRDVTLRCVNKKIVAEAN